MDASALGANYGYLERLRELVEQGAALGLLNDRGETAKDVAQKGSSQACVTLLENFELIEQEKKLLHSDLENPLSSKNSKQRKYLIF